MILRPKTKNKQVGRHVRWMTRQLMCFRRRDRRDDQKPAKAVYAGPEWDVRKVQDSEASEDSGTLGKWVYACVCLVVYAVLLEHADVMNMLVGYISLVTVCSGSGPTKWRGRQGPL